MTDTNAGVSADRQLQGKSNFVSWTRDFEHAAKAKDVFNLLNGNEKILKEPQEDTYLIDGPRASRTREVTQLATLGGETPRSDNLTHAIMKWQADHKRWENNRATVCKAKDLLSTRGRSPLDLDWSLSKNRALVNNDPAALYALRRLQAFREMNSESIPPNMLQQPACNLSSAILMSSSDLY